jgi:hypothetical protein
MDIGVELRVTTSAVDTGSFKEISGVCIVP